MSTAQPLSVRVEDRLYQNCYLVDSGRPHIKVKPHDEPTPELLALTKVCPAGCYALNDSGQVETTLAAWSAVPAASLPKQAAISSGLSSRRFRRIVQVRIRNTRFLGKQRVRVSPKKSGYVLDATQGVVGGIAGRDL